VGEMGFIKGLRRQGKAKEEKIRKDKKG